MEHRLHAFVLDQLNQTRQGLCTHALLRTFDNEARHLQPIATREVAECVVERHQQPLVVWQILQQRPHLCVRLANLPRVRLRPRRDFSLGQRKQFD